MSRRDTIIVAVLINAGLLIVLFASALKSSSGEDFVAAPAPAVEQSAEIAFKKENPVVQGDEVDVALKQFSQGSSVATAVPQESSPLPALTVTAASSTATSSFVDDLKMIDSSAPAAPESLPTTPQVQTLTGSVAAQERGTAEFAEVKVKKGDVLEKIARHHHTTVAEIMKANHLTSSNLRIGQTLKIPTKTLKKAEVVPVAHSSSADLAAQSEGGAKYYIVKKGDSPWTIAVKNHLKVEDLLKLNNMNEEQARRLKPGDKLRIQ